MSKTVNRDNQKALLVKKLAIKHGVKTDYIYKVLSGDRNDEVIFEDYMKCDEAMELLLHNLLAPCLPQIISFKNSKPKPLETITARQ